MTGGTITAAYWPSIGRFAGGVGHDNITGGTFYQLGAGNGFIVAELGIGELSVSGSGTVSAVGGIHLAQNTGSGTVDLGAGGTIIAPMVEKVTAGGTANFHFNGGTLTAMNNNNSTTFFQGLNVAYVDGGGAVFNDAGYAITVNQNLLAPAANGVTGFTLTSAGSGYIAPPLVTVSAPATGGVQATAYTTINAAGQVTGIVIGNPGSGYSTTPTFAIAPAPDDTTGSAPWPRPS